MSRQVECGFRRDPMRGRTYGGVCLTDRARGAQALFTIISNGSGQPHWRIEELHDRPTWRDSDWALDFGLIDGVLADDHP